jgi:hypothetical protein
MSAIPYLIKTKLAELSTAAEKYTLDELDSELQMLSAMIKTWKIIEIELTQPALKIE